MQFGLSILHLQKIQLCFLIYLYLKVPIGIIMLPIVQKGYNGDWAQNKCHNLKGFSLFWLIYNYIALISLIFYHIIAYLRAKYGSDIDL